MSAHEQWALLGGAAVVLGVLLTPKKAIAYVRGQPVEILLGRIGFAGVTPVYLRDDVARAFNAMAAAAKAHGVELRVSGPRSAFRTPEQQASLKAETPGLAATMNYSVHQEGRAVDLDVTGPDGKRNAAYAWLRQYAATYGFVEPYPAKEPWHWEHTA